MFNEIIVFLGSFFFPLIRIQNESLSMLWANNEKSMMTTVHVQTVCYCVKQLKNDIKMKTVPSYLCRYGATKK